MTNRKKKSIIIIFIFLLCSSAFAGNAQASCENWIAQVISIQGEVRFKTSINDQWQNASPSDRLCQGDTLQVQENSRAALLLSNEATLRLDQRTTMTFMERQEQKRF